MPYTGYIDPVTKERIPIPGVPGESAYEAAVKGGYSGTKEEFYKILATIGNVSNPNLLINGDFKINQRGQTEYTTPGYTVDRWCAETYAKVKVNENAIEISCLTENDSQGVFQIMECPTGRCTFAIKVLEVFGSGRVFVRDHHDGLCVFESPGTYITTIDNIKPLDAFHIRADVNSKIKIAAAKCELGNRFTGFYPTDPALELAKCQRYYERSSPWQGFNCVKANILLGLPFKVAKRTAPTITILSSNGIGKVTHFWDGAEASVGNIASTIYGIDYMDLNGAVAGEPYHYGYIADAEIY